MCYYLSIPNVDYKDIYLLPFPFSCIYIIYQAFGYSSAANAAARILASVLGGYTYGIEPDTMRTLFKGIPGHGAPLLSHLVASSLCIAAIIAFAVLYNNTPPAAMRKQKHKEQEAAATAAVGSLSSSAEAKEGLGTGGADNATAAVAEEKTAPSFMEGMRYVAGNRMLSLFIACYAATSFLSGMALMAIPFSRVTKPTACT